MHRFELNGRALSCAQSFIASGLFLVEWKNFLPPSSIQLPTALSPSFLFFLLWSTVHSLGGKGARKRERDPTMDRGKSEAVFHMPGAEFLFLPSCLFLAGYPISPSFPWCTKKKPTTSLLLLPPSILSLSLSYGDPHVEDFFPLKNPMPNFPRVVVSFGFCEKNNSSFYLSKSFAQEIVLCCTHTFDVVRLEV